MANAFTAPNSAKQGFLDLMDRIFAPLLVCGVNTVDVLTKIGAHHAVLSILNNAQVKAALSGSRRLLGQNLLTQLTPSPKKPTHGSEE